MEYYSISFVALLMITLMIFWALGGVARKWRIWILLFASFLFLWGNTTAMLFVSISGLLNVVCLRWVLKEKSRERWAILGVVANALLLLLYKFGGASWSHWAGDWILPLGLSFYTFQHIASWVRVRQEDWEEMPGTLNYLVYTVYFPKMLSGPVEKWEDFDGQLRKVNELKFDDAKFIQGLRYILWGAFAKWTIAPLAHTFYLTLWTDNPTLSGVLLGGVFNFIYIYADFSGYSNFVLGISWLFGIELIQNFRFPLFTNQVREFWQRWHISFTQWILDYLFTPLTFHLRSFGKTGIACAIVLSFLVVGLWHGLESNYIAFGLIQGLYFLPILLKWNWSERLARAKKNSKTLNGIMILPFFLLMSTTALIFSSASWNDFILHVGHIQLSSFQVNGVFTGFSNLIFLCLIFGFLWVEWWNRNSLFGLDVAKRKFAVRWMMYIALLLALMTWGEFKNVGTLYAHF